MDVRIIAATNRDLEEEIRRGTSARDLFYRLNVIALNLPPLRERRDDMPLLTEHFLERSARARAPSRKALASEALDAAWCTSGRATCASWRTRSSAPRAEPRRT